MDDDQRELNATAATVSVVITTYNRAALVGEAIDSVFAQEYPDLELVVVDDGSTDDTQARLAPYAGRLRVITRESNSCCPSVPTNAGIRASTGKYVALLDSDDVWLPGRLAAQIPLFEARRDVGIVYGNFCFMTPAGAIGPPLVPPHLLLCGSILDRLVEDMFVHTSTLVLRRSVLDEVGLLDENVCASEYYDLLLRMGRRCAAASVAAPVAAVRQHTAQHSRRSYVANHDAAAVALERFVSHEGLDSKIRAKARRSIGRFHTQAARLLLDDGRAAEARGHLLRAQRAYPFSRATWMTSLRALGRIVTRWS